MQMNPYLFFPGQCEAAFKFYAKVLGGEIIAMMPHDGTPAAENVPPAWRSKIIHARMAVGDKVLMGSDAPPDHQQAMQGFSVTLGIDDPAEAERVFARIGRKRHSADADRGDLLGPTLWHAGRPVRHAVDGQLRESGLIAFRNVMT